MELDMTKGSPAKLITKFIIPIIIGNIFQQFYSMADTIILMNHGKIQQQASPEVIYNDPNNVFTAQFIGTPSMNVFKMSNGFFYGYRPEKAEMTLDQDESKDAAFKTEVKIITREMLGSETLYKVRYTKDESIEAMIKSTDDSFREDQNVWINVALDNVFFFDGEEQRIRENEDSSAYAACVECLKGE